MLERIQKIISAAGVTSRRAAEQLILDGRVRVNGQVVTELGTKADAGKDHIKVDGKLINPKQPSTYVMLNKPAGYVTTMSDPEGRPTVLNLLKGLKVRVYPVGRLDFNTEGLLLLTNDGDFAHLVTHPKHEFPKTYRAKVKGVLEDRQIAELEAGVYLDDGRTAPAKLKKVSKEEANSWLEITIHEGKKRQVRRMFDRVGHSVIKLKRIRTGNLLLGDLPEGAFRYLTPEEVQALKDLAVKEKKAEIRRPIPEAGMQRGVERTRKPEPARERTNIIPRTDSGRRTAGGRPAVDKKRTREPQVTAFSGRGQGPGPRNANRAAAAGFTPRGGSFRPEEGKRPWPGERRSSEPRPGPKSEGRWKSQGPRVPGQGASGRGARRPPRDEGTRQKLGFKPAGPGPAKHAESREKRPWSKETRRPAQGPGDRGASRSSTFKPRGPKTTAARIRGKIFDTSPEQQPKARKAAGDSDRKSQRPYGIRTTRKPAAHGSSRTPDRSRR
jgi:23S rRNA pseudouridine2605 synthase